MMWYTQVLARLKRDIKLKWNSEMLREARKGRSCEEKE